MKTLNIISIVLLLIGWLNWWLVGIFDFDLVAFIFWAWTILANIVYILVWISALYILIFDYKILKK